MKKHIGKIGLSLALLMSLGQPLAVEGMPAAVEQTRQNRRSGSASKKRTTSQPKTRAAAVKKGNSKKRGSSGSAKPETSEDVRRRHEAAQKDIRLTEEQIRQNEAKIKKSLSDLNRINSEIAVTRTKVSDMAAQLNKLNSQITSLEGEIAENEKTLAKLRSEYLKAVKKMRQSKRNRSTLAFIFASENFNQALRRMRYMRQFSEWKDKQSAEINKKVEQLKLQTALLEQTRADKDRVYSQQLAAQKTLETQGRQQDALVGELRKNGEALKTHLSKKQAEANALKNRIASLIAAEEQRAAEQRAARERAEAERKAKEKAAAEAKAEAERQSKLEAERQAAEKKASESKPADKKKETPKPEKKKEEKKQEKPKTSGSKDYAEARKRKPRGDSGKPSTTQTPATPATPAPAPSSSSSAGSSSSAASSGNFGAMRGSLPRPVDGSWRVTSRFGRQSLPDLPDVVYDNPGIDAEVANGSTAKAVYGGKVSGVYMIPGFGTVVIVSHGDYFTVYGNLASASVKSGDTVKQGQSVGKVGASQDDPSRSSIHFEVWKHRDKLNPQEWIR